MACTLGILLEKLKFEIPLGFKKYMADITVIILTFNEELHLLRALESVKKFAKYIYVVDSYSNDNTEKIAIENGATFVQHEFISQAHQMIWAINHLPIFTSWVMRLDADEVVDIELATEINSRIHRLSSNINGVVLNCRQIFMGRWIRFGGVYPLRLLRIWRNGFVKIENRYMDEHMLLTEGNSVRFEGHFSNHDLNNLTYFTNKHNKYASREALEILNQRKKLNIFGKKTSFKVTSGPRQVFMKQFIKSHVYNKLPFWAGPITYLNYRLFLRGGIFDGREGIIYHFLQGFWYRFLIDAKIFESRKSESKNEI